MFISFSLILFFFYGFYYNFSKKLVLLLLFESVYICLIYIGLMFSGPCSLSSNFLVYMMVFMVLDSVFGICLLVSCVRNSSLVSWNFYSL